MFDLTVALTGAMKSMKFFVEMVLESSMSRTLRSSSGRSMKLNPKAIRDCADK